MIEAGNVLLFLDELHTVIGAGGAEGAIDASNILKPSLARGELQLIGATTIEEYRKYIERDAALERRFQPVTVEEPTVEQTVAILAGLKPQYEQHHQVVIEDGALQAAAKMADRYINDRFLPDKAIDLIDEASSRVRLAGFQKPLGMRELEQSLQAAGQELEEALEAGARLGSWKPRRNTKRRSRNKKKPRSRWWWMKSRLPRLSPAGRRFR